MPYQWYQEHHLEIIRIDIEPGLYTEAGVDVNIEPGPTKQRQD